MKILLDECLPRQLSRDLVGHDVAPVTAMGWSGVKNGALLRLAEDSFDVFVTIDRNMQYQQSFGGSRIAIVLMAAVNNRRETLRPLVPRVLSILETIAPGDVVRIGDA